MQEIERKYLVKSDAYKNQSHTKYRITQGFLNTHKERTVRVRIKGDTAFLTVKGKSNDAGTIRMEWEKEIGIKDAEALLAICEKGQIDKIRYEIQEGNHTYEVDEFFLNNKGLTIAEVELSAEDETFEKPDWLGAEVTGDVKYYNSQLSKHPFSKW